MSRIVVVDYGMGNLRSVHKALLAAGLDAAVSSSPRAIERARAIVLPGVGAFGDCMRGLVERGLLEPLRAAIAAGKPYLGLCLGLQILFDRSEEFGRRKGLGLIPGTVVRFAEGLADERGVPVRIPHMGWNSVRLRRRSPLFAGIPSGTYFYFVHSYYARPECPEDALAATRHGIEFASAVQRDNLFACQFHPEKSQAAGLRLLANFGALVR